MDILKELEKALATARAKVLQCSINLRLAQCEEEIIREEIRKRETEKD